MTYSNFKPANDKHALIEMAVFLHFTDELSDELLKKLEALRHDLVDDLPQFQETNGLVLEVQTDQEQKIIGSQQKIGHVGFELKRIGADGSPEWVVNIEKKNISIHCLNYTRWHEVFPKVLTYIQKIFERLGFIPNTLNSIALKCLDGFEYDAPQEQYRMDELFNPEAEHIAQHLLFRNSLRWHCHTGWYARYEENHNIEVLNQLNINAGFAVRGGAKAHLTTIDHTQTLHSKPGGDIGSVLGDLSVSNELFRGLMTNLHEMNKTALSKLLTENVKNEIGIS